MLTQKKLKSLLHYAPSSGVFTNRFTRGNVKAAEKENGYSNASKIGEIGMDVSKQVVNEYRGV